MCQAREELLPLEEAYIGFISTVQSAEENYTRVVNESYADYCRAVACIMPQDADAMGQYQAAWDEMSKQIASVENEAVATVRTGFAEYTKQAQSEVAKLPVEVLDYSTSAAIGEAMRITSCLAARWAVAQPPEPAQEQKGRAMKSPGRRGK